MSEKRTTKQTHTLFETKDEKKKKNRYDVLSSHHPFFILENGLQVAAITGMVMGGRGFVQASRP